MSPDAALARALLDIGLLCGVVILLRPVLRRIQQPGVLACIFAGIVVGPSLLGRLPGDPTAFLFPEEVTGVLSSLGGIGLVLFAFLVGMEFDLGGMRTRSREVLGISAGAVALPLLCGAGLAVILYPRHHEFAGQSVPALSFTLFVATAVAVTAFPVLVSILDERGVRHSRLGSLVVASAALQDLVGWLLLAAALASVSDAFGSVVGRVVLQFAAFLLALFCLRPVLRRCLDQLAADPVGRLTLTVAYISVCAGVTQLIGLHVIAGAFAAGLFFPARRESLVGATTLRALQPLTVALFLPLYFLGAGLKLQFDGLGLAGLLECALITLVACMAKVLGGAIPTRLFGRSWYEAAAVGVLVNTRGLVELVILTLGYTEGILDPGLFSEMVVMAVLSTMLTNPLLNLLGERVEWGVVTVPVVAPEEAEVVLVGAAGSR